MTARELVVLFTPNAANGTWTLRARGSDAFPHVGVDGTALLQARPDVARLGEQMLDARAGCVIRTTPDGAIEISATDRSAMVLYAWLLDEIARRPAT